MPRSSAVLAHPNSQPYGSDGRMFFIAKSTSSATQSSITGSPTPSIMKTSKQQTSQGGKDKSTYSQEASLVNLSVQQDGDLERTMTAISGQRCYESSGRYSPLLSLVRTLLVSSRWYSPAKRLRWEAQPLSSRRTTTFTKKSKSSSSKPSAQTLSVKDTPSSRLLFRLVPSVRPINETECGSSQEGMFPHLLLTPCTREFCEDPASMRMRAKRNGYKNGTKFNSLLSQIIYSDMLPTPLTQDLKVCENGKIVQTPSGTLRKVTPTTTFSLGLARMVQFLPTPYAQDFKKRGLSSKQKGLPEIFRKWDWLLTPGASDGMRAMMTMENLKSHRKKNAAQSNLSEQIAHKIGGGTSQLSPLFVEEMMGYPLIYLVLPFLSQDGDKNL